MSRDQRTGTYCGAVRRRRLQHLIHGGQRLYPRRRCVIRRMDP
jgi:hypothetical protein